MDQHPIVINIDDLEIADFCCLDVGTVGYSQNSPIFRPWPGCSHQDAGHLFEAEHDRQFVRFPPELHEPPHLFPPAGHTEEETQSADLRVVD